MISILIHRVTEWCFISASEIGYLNRLQFSELIMCCQIKLSSLDLNLGDGKPYHRCFITHQLSDSVYCYFVYFSNSLVLIKWNLFSVLLK